MRLFIFSMPIIALAMLASNYSAHHGWVDETRTEPDPQAKAIAEKIWGNQERNTSLLSSHKKVLMTY